MYQLTLVLVLLSIGNCCRSHRHGGGHGYGHGNWHGFKHDHGGCSRQAQYNSQDSNETKFDKLSSYFIDADRYVNNICKDNTTPQVQEIYGTSTYRLIYAIPSNDAKNITVQIKNRAIYVYAELLDENKTIFTNVRALPNILNTKDAAKSHMDDQLIIEIPYSITFDAVTKPTCGDVNEDLITVPDGGLGLRFNVPVM